MSRLTANLFMNSFNENLECLKTVLKWQDLCDAYKRTGTQVDKLNTCNMSVTSYTVTFK